MAKNFIKNFIEDMTIFKPAEENEAEAREKAEAEAKEKEKAEAEKAKAEAKEEAETKDSKAEKAEEKPTEAKPNTTVKAEPADKKAENPAELKAATSSVLAPSVPVSHEPQLAQPVLARSTPNQAAPAQAAPQSPANSVPTQEQNVVINGSVEVTNYNYGGHKAEKEEKVDPFAKAIEELSFSFDEEKTFADGSALYELKRARSEGEIPGAAKKFAELMYLKSPKERAKFIRKYISEALDADPELMTFIKESEARKHQVERRFKPGRSAMAGELLDEESARIYINGQKLKLSESLAEKAEDTDFGSWVFVEINGDTGDIRELTPEEAKPHEENWAKAQPKKKPINKKPASAKAEKG